MNSPSPRVEEALLGFDAREMFVKPSVWGDERRQNFLLRENVLKPLSVDTEVWPSLFGDGEPDEERKRLDLDALQLPQWKGPNASLWDDLNQMRSSLGRLSLEPHGVVAVSWVSIDGFAKPDGNIGPYREAMKPSSPATDWILLGFDVADAGLTSGLTNCAYSPAELSALRTSWGPFLNEHHLFTQVDKAMAFKELTEKRVPEHTPFFVFALSLINKD